MAIYNPNQYNWITKLYQFLAIWLLFVPVYYIFYRMKVYGRENIPKDKNPFVVMPNHLSNNDPPIVSTVLMIPIAYMAKKELFSMPVLGWAITRLGAFSVDREKVEKTTIKATKEIVNKGWCIGTFLEGTRNKTPGILGKPNIGPAYISNLNSIPILPVGIVGSNKLFGPVTVKIGKLFYPDRNLENAKWQCAKKLAELTGFKIADFTKNS
ncbi:MAG: 1-acyl-sn-glycerol-3-phosphate acyltransferase [Candidatus Melainabacteria bacterium]|nr:1-acyl-sn-glycerol-3-phosphate acyltransferase [Candidatus Melainabacteria bacterium]